MGNVVVLLYWYQMVSPWGSRYLKHIVYMNILI